MSGLSILGRDIFWLVGFLSDAVFCGVMVFGGFLVWVVFDAVAFLGLVVFGLGMVSTFGGSGFCSVSVGFCAFGCCGLLFLYWGVGWFGGLVFVAFL